MMRPHQHFTRGFVRRGVCTATIAASLLVATGVALGAGDDAVTPLVEPTPTTPATAEQSAPASSTPPTTPAKRPLGMPESQPARRIGPDAANSPSSSPGTLRTFGSLIGVLALLLLLAHGAKRVLKRKQSLNIMGSSRSPAGVLEVLGRYPIGSGLTLMLLKVDRRILLLSQNGGGMLPMRRGGSSSLSTLCEIDDAEEVASILTKTRDAEGESIAAKFRELMSSYSSGKHDEAPAIEDDGTNLTKPRDSVAAPSTSVPAPSVPPTAVLPVPAPSVSVRKVAMTSRTTTVRKAEAAPHTLEVRG